MNAQNTNKTETRERVKNPTILNNGFVHILVNIVLGLASIFSFVCFEMYGTGILIVIAIVLLILWTIHFIGFKLLQPNQAGIFTFFGKYVGTVKENGFFWFNPFFVCKKLYLRISNMDVEPIKVNDKKGNPIMIGLIVVWKIKDTYKACFEVSYASTTGKNTIDLRKFDGFVRVQSDAALRKVAGMFAYDNIDGDPNEITLRSGGDEINERLEEELRGHLAIAGIEIIEARINYLAYSSEIASAMLRRQQADAIISAREKIVEGAVSMVDLALKKLSADNIVELDEERKASMVSNLLVVLCADESASPVINTGSLY
ncbi:MAG: SPFH domain-containing protein [Bacteroidales bacterium]|nr:SPFH domain-containing protein [Bacteroidales bacterium]